MIQVTKDKRQFKPVDVIDVNSDIYVINFAYKDVSDELATWVTEIFYHKPDRDELQGMVNSYYNRITDAKILEGFSWGGHKVWLSVENQFNYKALYDIAVQTSGASLPVTLKFGTDTAPSYVTFSTIDEFREFYHATMEYIQSCYVEGWQLKDAFKYEDYASIIDSAKSKLAK